MQISFRFCSFYYLSSGEGVVLRLFILLYMISIDEKKKYWHQCNIIKLSN
jgi:hypothetical protein